MSAARARGQAGNGRGRPTARRCGWHAMVPVLCREHTGEGAGVLSAQGAVAYCRDAGFGLLRLWEKLGLVEVRRCPAVLSSTPPQPTAVL